MKMTIECTAAELVAIAAEADQDPPYFGVAAELGMSFRGGFDHAEIKANGWTIDLHDRGMNGRSADWRFSVPMRRRTGPRGPLAS